MKLNGLGRYKSQSRNSWQQMKYARPYYDLFQALKGEPLTARGFQQKGPESLRFV